jgi:hypothetical protein
MKRPLVFGFVLWSTAVGLAGAPTVNTSASVRVLHDTNLFLQNPGPLAAGQTSPASPARESATAATAAVRVGVAFTTATKTTLDLGYAPEIWRYFAHGSENHTDHLFTLGSGFGVGEWTGDAKVRYLYTVGSDAAPAFNEIGGGPAIGGEPVRARRSQSIGRLNAKLTRNYDLGFFRLVSAVLEQDFRTATRTTSGYCNYADREESSIGVEGGWRVTRPVAAVAAVRLGEQRQADILGVPLNYSNTFARWLAGVEASPTPSLRLSLLAGPDIRHFGRSVRPGFSREQRTGYGEGSASWNVSSADTLTATAKNYLWVLGGGRGVYVDTAFDLVWKHLFAPAWSGVVGGNYHDGTSGRFMPAAPRHDQIYTETVGVSHALSHGLRVDLEVMHDQGVSLVTNMPGREYNRWITGLTVARTF